MVKITEEKVISVKEPVRNEDDVIPLSLREKYSGKQKRKEEKEKETGERKRDEKWKEMY